MQRTSGRREVKRKISEIKKEKSSFLHREVLTSAVIAAAWTSFMEVALQKESLAMIAGHLSRFLQDILDLSTQRNGIKLSIIIFVAALHISVQNSD